MRFPRGPVSGASIWTGAVAILCICMLALSPAGPSQDPSSADRKLALLIGCTEYPELRRLYENQPQTYERIRLFGPAQDVQLFRRVLIDRLKFEPESIQTLVGWDERDRDSRPTRANILGALRRLEEAAAPGARVVVLFAGHGSQQPTNPASQSSETAEEDGLDEIFLPADAGFWSEAQGGVANAIVDDEIAAWLERITKKGAFVWTVFDSCNSGSMTRGGVDIWARGRALSPDLLRIPASARPRRRSGSSSQAENPLQPKNATGQAVAFFAAQSFEQTFEIPLPDGAPTKPENYHGVLSYFLVEALTQWAAMPTYRELIGHVQTRGNALLPYGPRPHGEGDLDRVVLGLDFPGIAASPFRLEKTDAGLLLTAGSLAGLTLGSVLSVREASAGFDSEPVGHVKIVDLNPTRAHLEPVGYGGNTAVAASALPDAGLCSLLDQPLGDLRIPVAVRSESDGGARLTEELRGQAAPSIRLVEESAAQWLIVLEEKRTRFIERSGDPPRPAILAGGFTIALGSTTPTPTLAAEISRQFSRVFKWRNLLRVAGSALVSPDRQSPHRLEVSLAKCDKADCLKLNPIESGASLRVGDVVRLTLVNRAPQALDVTALALDSAFGVQALHPREGRNNRLPAGGRMQIPLRVSAAPLGRDWILIISVPARGVSPVDFAWLAQQRLAARRGGSSSAFEQMLREAAFGAGTRGAAANLQTDAEAELQLLYWESLPPALDRSILRRLLASNSDFSSVPSALRDSLSAKTPSEPAGQTGSCPAVSPWTEGRRLSFLESSVALLQSASGEAVFMDLDGAGETVGENDFEAAFLFSDHCRTAVYDSQGDGVFDLILVDVEGDETADRLHQLQADGHWASWLDVQLNWIDGRFLENPESGRRLIETVRGLANQDR